MFSSKQNPKNLPTLNNLNERPKLLDGAIILGGVLMAAFTLQSYRSFHSPAGIPKFNKLSAREAESTAGSIRSYLEKHPEDFNAWARLAVAFYYQGPSHYSEGLNAVEKARSLGATSETLFYYAGRMYESLGLPEYAYQELSKYSRHYPDDFETRVRLANLLSKQGKTEDAYKEYKALTDHWPKDATLWFNFGVVCKEKGDWDGALACFTKAKELSKDLPEGGIFQQGEVMRLKGSMDEAMVFYQQELARNPRHLPSLLALESLQRKKSLWKEAAETRKKIAEVKAAS